MKSNYFIIHGSFSNPFSNWIPWLRKEIENRGVDNVYTPDLPSGVGYQNFANWNAIMNVYKEAGLIDENTVLFAHSIAPVFVAKYLITNKIKVKKLIFVCGFNNYLGINDEYDEVNKTMYLDNLSDIKNYCDDIICFYSKNDPYVKYEVEKEFADTIATRQIIIEDGGHLNAESGYLEFPDLLEYI